jgi:SAM-dependent methyltransferase
MALPGFIRHTVRGVANTPVIGKALRSIVKGRLRMSFRWQHPIDRFYGIDTSGVMQNNEIVADRELARKISCYMGIQPSIVRRSLGALTSPGDYAFIDLGCGKGRLTVVASEFPFHSITGIEISPKLADIAARNAAIIGAKFPPRTKINIIAGDAVDFPVTGRRLVLYIYNSFGPELMEQLLKNIERHLEQNQIDHLFLVYHHPVSGAVFDRSKALKRWFAAEFPADPEEKNYGLERESATVIWQSIKNACPDRHAGAGRSILLNDKKETSLGA